MKKTVFVIFLLVLSAGLSARNVSGSVKCGKNGIPGVVITDGKNFTSTSTDGTYILEAADNAFFVYMAVPSGYNPPFSSGTPVFYEKLEPKRNVYDFTLSRSASADSYVMIATADPHIRNEKILGRFRNETLRDMDSLSKSYLFGGNIAVAGIDLGDLVWDAPEYFGKYKKAISSLKYPCYQVIGNHDHDKTVNDDVLAASNYRNNFGPTYYAFDLGHDYYVVLDDILYKGNKKYDDGISDEQLDWLEGYLNYVPKGSHVIVAMHIPYIYKFTNTKIGNNGRLMDILEGYKVNFMSGHTHVLATYEVEPGITEFNVASAGGAWWIGDYCTDGTPLGYEVFESRGCEFSWYYKIVAHSRNFQMELYNKGEVDGDTECVYAKVWGWDPEWKVEWFQDGKYMGRMEQCSEKDPHYSSQVNAAYAKDNKPVAAYRRPRESFFFFKAKPEESASLVEVIATDRFGRKYEDHMVIK
ncbi:MAG: calcineurin-like phosphoesterase family protein [Bacteroidales bacterium]|jgi:hypothetical protein|nr:calcineurin-like phosphoesterase family protein [Bacteroidales bacterium]MCI2146295.1 calcineurin-like phosphoesterase family protein [Bacteroidales bacterium]